MSAAAKKKFQALTSRDQKREAIQGAANLSQLDTMAAAWEERGWAKTGLLYAEILEKKVELGYKPTAAETELLEKAAVNRVEGAKLPPITGKLAPFAG